MLKFLRKNRIFLSNAIIKENRYGLKGTIKYFIVLRLSRDSILYFIADFFDSFIYFCKFLIMHPNKK